MEAEVQFRELPVLSTAVALYEVAPNTKSHVAVTMLWEQLYIVETFVTPIIAEEKK